MKAFSKQECSRGKSDAALFLTQDAVFAVLNRDTTVSR